MGFGEDGDYSGMFVLLYPWGIRSGIGVESMGVWMDANVCSSNRLSGLGFDYVWYGSMNGKIATMYITLHECTRSCQDIFTASTWAGAWPQQPCVVESFQWLSWEFEARGTSMHVSTLTW